MRSPLVDNDETTPEFDPFATEKEKPRRGGVLLGALALLVALAVATWNGWSWWQDRQAADVEADLGASVAELMALQAELQRAQQAQAQRLGAVERLELEAGLARLDEAVGQARSVAGSDRARLAGLEAAQEESAERLEGLESRVAALVVRGESPRKGLELAEVDYLLRSANERLRLYGDVRTADQALSLADAQLAALDDPVYLPVRQAIAGARLELEEVERPDEIALTATLEQLQARIPGLPFPGQVTVSTATEDSVAAEEDPGVWARFKTAMSGLVSVRRRDVDESLVSLDDKDTVRQGLWLQLEAARLALLRQDEAAFSAAVARAQATVDQYFDAEAVTVERFRSDLDELAGVRLAVTWPDISEPWTRLRSIRSAAAPVASPVEAPGEPRPAEPVEADAGAAGEAETAEPEGAGEDAAAGASDDAQEDDGETGGA